MSLQIAEKIDTVVLDKTGTMTQGKPVVSEIRIARRSGTAELLRLAAPAEQYSEHPLAKAIVAQRTNARLLWSIRKTSVMKPVLALMPGRGKMLVVGNIELIKGHLRSVPRARVDEQEMCLCAKAWAGSCQRGAPWHGLETRMGRVHRRESTSLFKTTPC